MSLFFRALLTLSLWVSFGLEAPAWAQTVSPSAAQTAKPPAPPDETGPEFAARVGYATPFGRFQRGERLREDLAGALPMWVDVGYRLTPRWFLGAYGQYGVGFASATSDSACPSCQHTWIRLGLQAQYRWYQRAGHSAWVGLGVGREMVNSSIDRTLDSSRSTQGWEWFNVQAGSEWELTPGLGLGPYLGLSLASFSERTELCREADCPVTKREVEVDLQAPGLHGWVNAGVRIVLLP